MNSVTHDDLAADLERESTAWKPDAGEVLIGELIEVSEWDGGYGTYPVLTLKDADGQLIDVHCFHTVLRSEVGRLNPDVGTTLGIKYQGKVEGRSGSYHGYRVRLAGPVRRSVNLAQYANDDGGQDAAPSADGDVAETTAADPGTPHWVREAPEPAEDDEVGS